MQVSFYKYHGTGNDFILLDNREQQYNVLSQKEIAFLCHRRFGIGADGLMLLNASDKYDFKMIYFNSDGGEGSMCGNGGRCIVNFAQNLGIIKEKTLFIGADGEHEAFINEKQLVKLQMQNVSDIEMNADYYYLNTGSPHYVSFVKNVKEINVVEEGRKIRYNSRFKEKGTNVNFVEALENAIYVRTYERGVEDETLSCGTGSVASAICANIAFHPDKNSCHIKTSGGDLHVYYKKNNANQFSEIWLEGPAVKVYEGKIEI